MMKRADIRDPLNRGSHFSIRQEKEVSFQWKQGIVNKFTNKGGEQNGCFFRWNHMVRR